MRRSRRGGGSGTEFGSSGEDSFVAVVVTKLTGALLFILLLTMVIMALLPKAVDLETADKTGRDAERQEGQPLRIATPTRLPEAVAGRAYLVALAATGGRGPLRWSVAGSLPEWLTLDADSGQLAGTPPSETAEPLALDLGVSDGADTARQPAQLLVLPGQVPSTAEAWLKQHLKTVPWRAWLEHGVGFLVLWLVHLLGMNLLSSLERGSVEEGMLADGPENGQLVVSKRFASYRLLVRLATLTAMITLALWLFLAPAPRP
jgi:preprotein translocase subunit SecG